MTRSPYFKSSSSFSILIPEGGIMQPTKDEYRKKCSHMKEKLSNMRTSQIIMTNKKHDDLIVDLFCEQCEKWCFGVEISSCDGRKFDYGKDLIPIKVEDTKEVTPESANYFNMKLTEEHRNFKAVLKKCSAIGCLNSVFRNKPPCSEISRYCAPCQASQAVHKSEIDI